MKHDPDFEKLVESILPKIREVTLDQIHQRLPTKNFTLIDVREKDEWQNGYIPGAIHIGKGVIERDIAKFVKDKSQELVLYCGGGYRSALATDNLQKMGYKNVSSMAGGMRGWLGKNYPVKK